MKKLILSLTLISLAAFTDEYRTFTARDGRTLKARVVSYDAASGKVRVKPMEPGEEKTVSTGSVTILKRTVGKSHEDKINLEGTLAGAWIKLTMKSPDGESLVREIALPSGIMKKYPWNPEEEEK
jgi:hypothetical protein